MGATSIEWCDSSWNFITGCDSVSPGCDHCYARTLAERFRGVPGNAFEQGFDLKFWPERLALPSKWKRPRRIFVNSMSDLFHKDVPDSLILDGFDAMVQANHHIYQILTKRPSRLANTSLTQQIVARYGAWPAHIWIGTSIERDDYVWRADKLRAVPADIRFISAEPLLGPLPSLNLDGIKWLITGAESGHGARPMNEDWVRGLRDACLAANVAFFYKQKVVKGKKVPLPELDGKVWNEYPVIEKGLVNV